MPSVVMIHIFTVEPDYDPGQGNCVDARSLLEQSLALFHQDNDKPGVGAALPYMSGLTIACSTDGESTVSSMSSRHTGVERGVRLLGAAEAILKNIGAVFDPLISSACEQDIATARAGLGEGDFVLAREQGRATKLEQMLDYAHEPYEQVMLAAESGAQAGDPYQTRHVISSPPKLAGKEQGNLTEREAEVLRLLAASLTDGQIADSLAVSRRTVQAHVRSIYSKLNVANRSAATRYAIERLLLW